MKNNGINKSSSSGFIQIPKVLFQDPRYNSISAEAKLLYGLLKDRSALSMSNGDQWIDNNGNVFVYYTHAELMERLNCGSDKARNIMRELENVGLIERTWQGLCKPYRLVVKNAVLHTENTDSLLPKKRIPDAGKTNVNKDLYNNADSINTESPVSVEKVDNSVVKAVIKENICFDALAQDIDPSRLNLIVDIMADAICTKAKTVKIAGEKREPAEVRHRFMSLNDTHIRYINDRIENEASVVYSIRGYILTHLYDAEAAMDLYYKSRAAHDSVEGSTSKTVARRELDQDEFVAIQRLMRE